MRRLPVFLVALFLGAAPAVRADDWPVSRGPADDPKPYRYDAKLLKDVPKEFLEDAAACVLFTRTTHLVEPDGTVVTITHEITRFNGRKGIEKLGEYRSIYFNPRHDKLTLNDARVLKADGSKVEVEPRHVQLRDVGTDYQVYDDDKQLVISWPNLQVGDAYEVKWTVRSKNPEYAGEFFTRYSFGDEDFPVVRDELYVRVPPDKPLKYAAVNAAIDLTRTESGGQRDYHWQVVNKQPPPHDEERPSKEELLWQVACTTFPSWAAVGKWKQQVRAECWECTDAIAETVAKVAGPQKTPLDKTRALTYWVRQNIRYLSRGPEGKGFTPHPPARVHANLFGDCKDQAQLLAVMLRRVGVPVWLVTLGTRDDGQVLEEVPSPWGTHAILLAVIDGKGYWIDTTLSQAAWDFLPRGDCDRLAYLTKDGEVKLARTPPFTYKDYRVEQTTHMRIAADGTSHSRREARYHGTGAWYKRDAWIDAPLGERRRLVASEVQDAHSRARLIGLKVDEKSLRDFDGPVRAELEFEVADHFGGEAREGTVSDGVVWTRLLAYTLDPGRELPFELPTPFESDHRYIVELPAALRCSQPPEEKRIDSPWGFFELTVATDALDPRRVEVRMHTRIEKTRVEKEQFAAFQRFHDDVAKAYRGWLTLRPTRDLADAPALEKLLTDPHSAKVLARLYLDNDRTTDARRVLVAALDHTPDDKALWELRLQASDPAEKEQHYRAMIARFPKDEQYAAALGANLLERGRYSEADKVLQPLTANTSTTVRGAAHYQLARACFRQGRFKDALKHLDTAVESDAGLLTEVPAIEFKARVHEKLGDAKAAIATYRMGLEGSDKSYELLYSLAKLEMETGQDRDALDHVRRYTVAVGKDAEGLVKAADLHVLLGRYDDALELVGRVPKERLTPAAHRVLGIAHFYRLEYAEAIPHLERAPDDDQVLVCLIDANLADGNIRAAHAAVAAHRPSGDGNSVAMLAMECVGELTKRQTALQAAVAHPREKHEVVARALGRVVCADFGLQMDWPRDRVAKLVQESLKEFETAPALALRGWLAMEKGQLGKALADAEKAIAMQPPDARAYLVRGRVRLERRTAGALADLEEAAKLSERKDATVLHWLAAALAQAGRVDEALATQRMAVELRPEDAEMAEQLRALERKRTK